MKFLRIIFLALGLLAVTILLPLNFDSVYAKQNVETEIEVNLSKSKEEDQGKDEDKDTIYKPEEPVPVRVLPNTGEIITSFIYILIGLSLILFLFGLFVSRMIQNDIRWE